MTTKPNSIQSKKVYLRIIIMVVVFLIAREIFSDWDHFKAGLFSGFN